MAIAVLAWVVAIPLLGAMTGLRTMTPMAILCWFAYAGHVEVHRSWPFWTTKLITAVVFSVLAAGELIGDKLPNTPNRTSAFALAARVVFGGLVGAICAVSLHGSEVEGVLLGALCALAGAFVGFHIRQHLVRDRGYKDVAVAVTEDAIAIGLSLFAMGIVTG